MANFHLIMKINYIYIASFNQQKNTKIYENIRKYTKIYENTRKYTKTKR